MRVQLAAEPNLQSQSGATDFVRIETKDRRTRRVSSMTNHQENETFTYTYSAKQQEEIQKIRRKYEAPQEDKMEQLRRLDAGATKKATVRSITVGVLGALIMGAGMSLIMTNINEFLGMTKHMGMFAGIGVGIVGIILACSAYPIFIKTLAKERNRIAPEILRLSDELLK